MTFLISGGLSELSNVLAEQLLAHGKRVVILHNYTSTYTQISASLEQYLSSGQLDILNIENRNEEAILATLRSRQITNVIDCSLCAQTSSKSPLDTAQRLLIGVTCLLDAIRHYGKIQSMVLVSGESVYGANRVRDETQALTPVSFVGAAQMSVEAMVHSYAVSYRIRIVIGRLPAVLLTSAADLEARLDDFEDEQQFVNVLKMRDAAEGVACLSGCTDFTEPAEVFNVSGGIEYSVTDLKKKSNLVETRASSLTNSKISQKFGWNAPPISPEEFYATTTLAGIEIQPKFMIYGEESLIKSDFLKLLDSQGIPYKESKVDLATSGDGAVHQEILESLPSHLVYFSTNSAPMDGDCFTLRTNMSANLYLPWLLASEAQRASLHFTHVGTTAILTSNSTSSLMVKGHAERMITHFENALQLRVGPCVSSTNEHDNLLVQVREDDVDGETSVTVLEDCLPAMLEMTKNRDSGIFNLVNPGTIKFEEVRQICVIECHNNNSTKSQTLTGVVIECCEKLKSSQNAQQAVQRCAQKLYGN